MLIVLLTHTLDGLLSCVVYALLLRIHFAEAIYGNLADLNFLQTTFAFASARNQVVLPPENHLSSFPGPLT